MIGQNCYFGLNSKGLNFGYPYPGSPADAALLLFLLTPSP
jgi:hypothetical protein